MTDPLFAQAQPSFAEVYERSLVPGLFRPWAETLLGRVELAPGARVLDVACGTGIVARLARQRVGPSGRVVGVDQSPVMLAVARAVAPDIEWREGSATALPVDPSEAFDVVLCQQGLQFFPERPAAVREMRRTLAPEGRVAIAVWQSLERAPCFLALQTVAERHVGRIVDRRHSFGDAAALEALLADAGFTDVRVESLTLPMRFDDPDGFARLNAMAVIGMSERAKSIGDDERPRLAATIAADSAAALARFTDGDRLVFDLPANIATARI